MASSVQSPRESNLRIRVAPENLVLVNWPLRQRPVRSLIRLALVVLASSLIGRSLGHWAPGLIAGAALVIALWRTWLPVRLELSGRGLRHSVLGWRRLIPWTAIRRYEVCRDGVLLLPDQIAVPASPLRGLYVRWGEHRDEVLAHLDYYLRDWTIATRHSTQRLRDGARSFG